MPTYRCKPRLVEAEQFWAHLDVWPAGVRVAPMGGHRLFLPAADGRSGQLTVETSAPIYPGDWVVTNEEGVKRLVTNRVFEALYEPVVPVATETSTIFLNIDQDLRVDAVTVGGKRFQVAEPEPDAVVDARANARRIATRVAAVGGTEPLAEDLAEQAYQDAIDPDITRDETPRSRRRR